MGREGDGKRGRWEERETGWRRFAIGARDAENDGLEDGHGLQIRASWGDGKRGRWEERETGWRRFAIGARDAESDGLEDGHGLQIRAIDVCGSRITNPRHRCVRVTDCKSAPAM